MLMGWPGVEVPGVLAARPGIAHVLFDFDGTISLTRAGWPEVMVGLFLEAIPRRAGESAAEVEAAARDDIMRLNGKPTIHQMIRLAEVVAARGGSPRDPEWYKAEYLRRLDMTVGARVGGLAWGEVAPEALLVHGVRPLLDHLQALGLRLTLASGTDEDAVRREAELLGVARYFGGEIHGARPDDQGNIKRRVIDRIVAEQGGDGRRLLSFGDGHVEVEETKAVGGLAVAVASVEDDNGSGRVDEWKRARLLAVGADAVIPDYRDAIAFVDRLLGR